MKRIILLTAALACSTAGAAQAQTPGVPSAAPPPAASSSTDTRTLSKESLVGRDAYSQDQTLVGPVERVATNSDGRIQAIFIRTGGFLGFGARLVSVPEGKFQMRGQNVQLQLTSEEMQKLPDVKDGS